jgi:hypothetical protein
MNTYSAYLRIRHPSMDPREVTRALGLEPAHSWAAGSPRDPDDPDAPRGNHRDSYWLAALGEPLLRSLTAFLPPDPAPPGKSAWRAPTLMLPLEAFLLSQIRLLTPCKSFLARISDEGGSCDLAVTMNALDRWSVEFPPALLRSLADLNIAVTIDVSTGTDAPSN